MKRREVVSFEGSQGEVFVGFTNTRPKYKREVERELYIEDRDSLIKVSIDELPELITHLQSLQSQLVHEEHIAENARRVTEPKHV